MLSRNCYNAINSTINAIGLKLNKRLQSIMCNCSICDRKMTRSRSLYSNTNICSECLLKMQNNDYIIFTNNSVKTLSDTSDHGKHLSIKSNDGTLDSSDLTDGEIFKIDANGTEVKLTEEINIEVEPKPVNCMQHYKDALLASLYSQLEFLKNELEGKNLLIRTLIIKEADAYNYNEGPYSVSEMDSNSKCADEDDRGDSESEENLHNSNHVSESVENRTDEFYNDDMSIVTDDYFKTLYMQYVRERKENLDNQLKRIKGRKA